MPSSTWGLLLLAGLNCLAPASLIQEEDTLLHDHEKHNYKIAPNMADFAYTLYRQVAHQSSTTNIFISPLSIAQAFVILAMGATGQWKDTFESEHLVGNFHVDKKTTIRGPMTQYFGKFHVLYDKKLSSWVVLQHYMGNPAFLFMPKQGMIQQLEARLCRRELARIRRGIKNRSASLLLPKLSISGTYDLETFLGKLGIARVFSNGAELSGISEEVPLKLSKALHKAVMTIDDNVKEHSGDSLLKKEKEVKHVTIKFNRPFLVYIMDETLSFPLFMGRMVKPPGK
uniref:Serpin family A member 1 n=1 Tax=Molossus molossus TaxID=27622 RepID=A0A7J8K1S3_MOLMO|nr:serpin family A member 1 [Molossus molossus]